MSENNTPTNTNSSHKPTSVLRLNSNMDNNNNNNSNETVVISSISSVPNSPLASTTAAAAGGRGIGMGGRTASGISPHNSPSSIHHHHTASSSTSQQPLVLFNASSSTTTHGIGSSSVLNMLGGGGGTGLSSTSNILGGVGSTSRRTGSGGGGPRNHHHNHNSNQPLPPISAYIPTQRKFSSTSIDLNSDATELSRHTAVVTPVGDETFRESDSMGRKYEDNDKKEDADTKNNSPSHAKNKQNHLSEMSARINASLSVTARALNLDEKRRTMIDSRESSESSHHHNNVLIHDLIVSSANDKQQQDRGRRNQLPQTARTTISSKNKTLLPNNQNDGLPPKPSSNSNLTSRTSTTSNNNNNNGRINSVVTNNQQQDEFPPSPSSSKNKNNNNHKNNQNSQNSSRISSADSRTSSVRNAHREEDRLLHITREEKQNHYEHLKQEMATMLAMRKQGRRLSQINAFQQKQQKKAVKAMMMTSQQQQQQQQHSLLVVDQEDSDLTTNNSGKIPVTLPPGSNSKIDSASLLSSDHDRHRMKELTQDRISKQKDQLHEMLGKFQETLKLNSGLAAFENNNNNNNGSPTSVLGRQSNTLSPGNNNNTQSNNNSPTHYVTKTEQTLQSLTQPELILLPEVEARLKKEEEQKRRLTYQLQDIIVSGRGAGGGKITAASRKQASDHVHRGNSPFLSASGRRRSQSNNNNNNHNSSVMSRGTSPGGESSLSARRNKYSVGGTTLLSDKILSGSGGQKAHQEVREKIRLRRAELEAMEPELRVQLAKKYVDDIDGIRQESKRKQEERRRKKLGMSKNGNDDDEEDNNNNNAFDDEDVDDHTFLTSANTSKKRGGRTINSKSPGFSSSARTKAPSPHPLADSCSSFENETQREIAEKSELLNRLQSLRDERNQPLFFTMVPHKCAGGGEVTQFISKTSRDSVLAREQRREEDKNGPARVTEVHATTKISARGDAEAEQVRKRKHDLMKQRIDDINDRIDQKEKAATLTGANAHTVVKMFSTWICVSQAARRFAEVIAEKWQPFDGEVRANAAFHPPYSPQRLKELADASQMIQRHMFRYRVRSYFQQRGQAAHNILLAMRHVVRHMRWRWAVHQFLARVQVVQRTMRGRFLRRRGRLILWQKQWQRIEPLLLRLTNLYRDPDVRSVLGKAPFDSLMKDGVPVIQSTAMTERGSLTTSKKLREMKKLEEVHPALISSAASLLLHLQQNEQQQNASSSNNNDPLLAGSNNNSNHVRLLPIPEEKVRDQVKQIWNHSIDQVRRESAWYFQNKKTQAVLQQAIRKTKQQQQLRKNSLGSGMNNNTYNNQNLANSNTFASFSSIPHAGGGGFEGGYDPFSNAYSAGGGAGGNNSTNINNNNNDDKDFPLLPLFLPFEDLVSRIVDMQKDYCLLVRNTTNSGQIADVFNNNNSGTGNSANQNNNEAAIFGVMYEASTVFPSEENNSNHTHQNNHLLSVPGANNINNNSGDLGSFANASAVYQAEHQNLNDLINKNNNNLRQQQKPSFRSFSIAHPSSASPPPANQQTVPRSGRSGSFIVGNNNTTNTLQVPGSSSSGSGQTPVRRRSFLGGSALLTGSGGK